MWETLSTISKHQETLNGEDIKDGRALQSQESVSKSSRVNIT